MSIIFNFFTKQRLTNLAYYLIITNIVFMIGSSSAKLYTLNQKKEIKNEKNLSTKESYTHKSSWL